jgi:hypothetical protein
VKRLHGTKALFLADRARVLTLSPWGAHSVRRNGQLSQALLAIEDSAPDKAALFRTLWPGERYSPHLHDSRIWSLMTRLRGMNLSIALQDERISADGILVVGEERLV